ncbi:MAG: dihydrodipicolinate synthase family protein [Armatimonadaceae bacterium]
MENSELRRKLAEGLAIPAHPLALDASRQLDERRQRALARYYIASGVGGLAVGVHTTQFAIRDPKVGLFEPVLDLAREEMDRGDALSGRPLVRVGGIAGKTRQATGEAETLRRLGYHAGLLSLAAMSDADDAELVEHCKAVGEVVPLIGFYLQPSVGGRVLGIDFWRKFFEIPSVVAVKVAPFHRYRTLDVVRALAESGRDDVALYTGNDDNIVLDLITPHRFEGREYRFVGGLLGHWSAWTKTAVELLAKCRDVSRAGGPIPQDLLATAIEVTDSNAAFFDAANGFHGCIAGMHEVLRRQGLLEGIWCLDPNEGLSPGQAEEIARVSRAYPHLSDDEFVASHKDEWLAG